MTRLADVGAAVIGSGFIGTVHIEALRRIGVPVVGLVESSPELGATRANELGLPRSYASLAELLADDAVQVVHVTSPNALHHAQVKQILAAGRHVICEKPLAMTSAESGELVELASASGLVNAVNFNLRFYPLNQHLAGFIAEGGLGEVRLVTGHYLQDWLLFDTDWNWRLEKDKGGALRAVGDIGSHWLDLTSFLIGRRVEAVMADLTTFIPVRQRPAGRVVTFSTERAAETVPVDDRHRGRGHDHARASRVAPAAPAPSPSSARAARTASPTRSTAPRPPRRGNRSGPRSCGSGIATGPTSCCCATRPS